MRSMGGTKNTMDSAREDQWLSVGSGAICLGSRRVRHN